MLARETSYRGLKLLLQCAVGDPLASLEPWSRYVQEFPIDTISWEEYRMLPAVWKNLVKAGEDFPEQGRLRGIYRHTFAQNVRLIAMCRESVRLLQEAGFKVLVLKGVPLLTQVYPDLGSRPTQDYDLLVPPEQAREAVEFLLSKEFELECPPFLPPELRMEHAVSLIRGSERLDLHWYALREFRRPGEDEDLWNQAVAIELQGVKTLMPSPTHALCQLLLLASREPRNTYRYLLDIHFLHNRFAEDISVDYVAELLVHRGVRHRLSYLEDLERAWPGFPSLPQAGPADRLWSWCSRYVFEGRHEMVSGVYPLVDYLRHHWSVPESNLGLGEYMSLRLQVDGWRDFISRSWWKLKRTLLGLFSA